MSPLFEVGGFSTSATGLIGKPQRRRARSKMPCLMTRVLVRVLAARSRVAIQDSIFGGGVGEGGPRLDDAGQRAPSRLVEQVAQPRDGLPPRGRARRRARGVIRVAVVAALFAAFPATASAATVESGALSATLHEWPWHVEYDAVDEAPRTLAFTAGGVTANATRATGGHMDGRAYVATLQTDDPLGRSIAVRVAPAGDGTADGRGRARRRAAARRAVARPPSVVSVEAQIAFAALRKLNGEQHSSIEAVVEQEMDAFERELHDGRWEQAG
jgi:hypothetical protein